MADATGWSVDYILNKVNYQTLITMLNDAPRYKTKKKDFKISGATPGDEAAGVANFFASNLKK